MIPASFDFTFDCPVYLFGHVDRGPLLTDTGCLPMWTDEDAASTFIERNRGALPDKPSLFAIETDEDLLAQLTGSLHDGIEEVAIDMTSVFQKTVQMLYTADLIDMLRERVNSP